MSLLLEAASALTFAGAYDESLVVLEEVGSLLAPTSVRERAGLVARRGMQADHGDPGGV